MVPDEVPLKRDPTTPLVFQPDGRGLETNPSLFDLCSVFLGVPTDVLIRSKGTLPVDQCPACSVIRVRNPVDGTFPHRTLSE